MTSSAVVGSSASSTFGSQASAIAIGGALAHAAGQLVREEARRAGAAGRPARAARGPAPARRARSLGAVHAHRLGDLPADGLHRVERVHRALEDQSRCRVQRRAVIAASPPVSRSRPSRRHLSGDRGGRRQQAHQREHRGRLAGARTRRPARAGRRLRASGRRPGPRAARRPAAVEQDIQVADLQAARRQRRQRARSPRPAPARPASAAASCVTEKWETRRRGLSASSSACPSR